MHSWWLSLHLGGAAMAGLTVLIIFIVIMVQRRQTYSPLAVTLAMLTGWQLVSGALLTLTTVETPTLLVYCRNVVAYLVVVSMALVLISRQMKISGLVWPTRRVTLPLSFGVTTAVVAGIILYT